MSVTSEPPFLGIQSIDANASFETHEPAKSVITAPAPGRRTSSRRKKLTEKGKKFHLELLVKKRNSVYSKLKEQIVKINNMRSSPEVDKEALETARDYLDDLKDKFHDAHLGHDELLETDVEKEASYRWFDLRDREYTECRIRLCERIQAIERESYKSQSDIYSFRSSVKSAKSKASKASSSSKSSKSSLSKALLNASAKAAKLQVEMEFLEQERELRRLEIEKAIAIATAEEKAIKRIIEEENKSSFKDEVISVKDKTVLDENDHKSEKRFPVKVEIERSSSLNGYAPFKVPEPTESSQSMSHDLSSALREIVQLQAKQTELSSLIVNQQRINHLPVKEPPIFSGDAFEYPAFVTAFDSIIAANVPSDRDRLYFLEKYTRGRANDVVRGFLAMPSDSAYAEARKILNHRFGNPVYVAEAYKSTLRDWPQIEDGNSSKLQEFSDFLVRCEDAMKCMPSSADIDNTQTLLHVCAKLPSYAGVKWCRHAHELQARTKTTVKFNDLVKFVREEAELANDPVFSPDALKREKKKAATSARVRTSKPGSTNFKPKASQSLVTSTTLGNSTTNPSHQRTNISSCSLCSGHHALSKCSKFLNHSADERSEIIRNKRLCFRCLREGHISARCPSKSSCEECGKRHNTLLHGVKPRPKPNHQQSTQSNTESPPSTVEKNLNAVNQPMKTPAIDSNSHASSATPNQDNDSKIITNSKIVPVILFHKDNPEKEVKVYALLDDASDTTFLSAKSQQHLGIKGVEMRLNLHTMLGNQKIPVERIDGLVVQRLDKRAEVELPKAYTRDKIPSRPDQVPRPEVAAKWPHLQKIQDKIPEYEENLEVGLLIGCNCPRAIKPKEVILGKSEEPYAIRTLLGWCIVGPVGESKREALIDSNSHRILSREVIPDTKDSLSFVMTNPSKEVMSPAVINRMFEMDFAECNKSSLRGMSQEDRRFIEIAEKGIHQCDDGHYELPLPLKNYDVKLPNNKAIALRRLNHLKGRFQSSTNQKYQQDYVAFMNKVIENGYAEKVPQEQTKQESRSNVWYIPHHGVYHPKKPEKIRVVFDCAANYKNESLNKHLLQGPDLTNNLTGVLCRFRQEPIAFTCDIEGMFHQVRVNAEHRDLLRFLWWDGGDITKEPQEYRMTVHLFGATSSPGCANFALKSTANSFENVFGTAAANFLRHDFYVDDGLKSVRSVKEAVELVDNVKQMCSQGGFRLHKFVSNSKEVIRSVPESDRADGVQSLDLDLDSLPLERTLGVHWCIESDCFQFSIMLQDKPCTRRGILSTVSSIFEPIGFVAPLLLDGKSILQELCRLQLGWDDPIPDDVKMRWDKWRGELVSLQRISIPRCYKPKDFGEVVTAELHHFSDASIKGYGQCSYLRLTDEHQRIHCSFVMGKSRVAPIKQVTIPRLELTAAVCSVRVSQQIHQELEYKIDQEYFWTDSKVILGYIANESRRFHVFVANRAQEIQESTQIEQWRYIESQENPADEASRGMTAQDLSNSRWIQGPAFLWNKHAQRLLNNQDSYTLDKDDKEIKKSVAMATTATVNAMAYPGIAERIEYFSDWYRAKLSVALCMRYVKCLKERVNKMKSERTAEDLRISDLEVAEQVIIREVQKKAFKEELSTLEKAKRQDSSISQGPVATKEHSSLYKLDPFVDETGILRVGGRLRHADLPDKIKFPVILPRKSHVTVLLIKHFHERTSHQGKGMTLNEIRSNGFWVIGGSSAVGNAILSCVKCRKVRGIVQEQRMSDLPKDRVESAPPFTYCAVDYFGPFMIKERRKELKRYGVLFTCMASRAIHLETANSLQTDSFINALRRFISRRGPIRQLRSDQGTNFVGARRELLEALEEMDHKKIKAELQKNQCDWFSFKMNVPAASHMGGVWERQIRSVRSALSSLLQNSGTQLDDESLRTPMCEAEAIVNSRPLTVNQLSDPNSPDSLAPNHLLTLKSKVVLSPPGVFQSADAYCRRRWRRVQHLANQFWTRWKKEFLLSLQERQKWIRPRRNLRVDDVVIVKEEHQPRNKWQLARVSAVMPSPDGQIRKVQVALADGCLDVNGRRTVTPRYLERPVQKLVLLMPAADDS